MNSARETGTDETDPRGVDACENVNVPCGVDDGANTLHVVLHHHRR